MRRILSCVILIKLNRFRVYSRINLLVVSMNTSPQSFRLQPSSKQCHFPVSAPSFLRSIFCLRFITPPVASCLLLLSSLDVPQLSAAESPAPLTDPRLAAVLQGLADGENLFRNLELHCRWQINRLATADNVGTTNIIDEAQYETRLVKQGSLYYFSETTTQRGVVKGTGGEYVIRRGYDGQTSRFVHHSPDQK